jgi:hypothetical protein
MTAGSTASRSSSHQGLGNRPPGSRGRLSGPPTPTLLAFPPHARLPQNCSSRFVQITQYRAGEQVDRRDGRGAGLKDSSSLSSERKLRWISPSSGRRQPSRKTTHAVTLRSVPHRATLQLEATRREQLIQRSCPARTRLRMKPRRPRDRSTPRSHIVRNGLWNEVLAGVL